MAKQEEEIYAQKTSQIREFYKNRPPSTVSLFYIWVYMGLEVDNVVLLFIVLMKSMFDVCSILCPLSLVTETKQIL